MKGVYSKVNEWRRFEIVTYVRGTCERSCKHRGQRARGKPSGGGFVCEECHQSHHPVSWTNAIRVESGDGR